MSKISEKLKSLIWREAEFNGDKILVKTYSPKAWEREMKKINTAKNTDKVMAEFISENIKDINGNAVFTPDELINDIPDPISEEIVNLIFETNKGNKKKGKAVSLPSATACSE